jgi:hypothetical protein
MPKLGEMSSTKERIKGLKKRSRKSIGGWRKGEEKNRGGGEESRQERLTRLLIYLTAG